MEKDKFSFGSKPRMKEVPPSTEAIFTFSGEPELVETEWGEKYSFPITLLYHPSYDTLPPTGNEKADAELEGQTVETHWESKSMVAKEISLAYAKKDKAFLKAYTESKWKLVRFDNGAYWIDQL